MEIVANVKPIFKLFGWETRAGKSCGTVPFIWKHIRSWTPRYLHSCRSETSWDWNTNYTSPPYCRTARKLFEGFLDQFGLKNCEMVNSYTVNPALLASSFVWQIQLSLLHISLFKVIEWKYFSQGKCEFMKFLFVLLDMIKILAL
jgi:hypothetical protein